MTLLITVVVGMFALMGSGLVFYYEPLDMAYKNIDTPVLHGYDLVAYFSLGTWSHGVRGKRSISLDNFYNWTDPRDNTTYSYSFWFSNDANRQKFVRDPWKYIPKYGGFSAYRTSTEDFWSAYPDSKVFIRFWFIFSLSFCFIWSLKRSVGLHLLRIQMRL